MFRWAVLVVVVGALAVAVVELRQRNQLDSLRASLDVLTHFDVEWSSDDMSKTRAAAASSLLQLRPSQDVDDVLDFFDQIAYLVERGAIDEDIAWYRFYWPMANYWFASQDYVSQVRRDDPDTWSNLDLVMKRLVAVELNRRKHTSPDGKPTAEQSRRFFNDEVGAGQCSDDSDDAQRTPL